MLPAACVSVSGAHSAWRNKSVKPQSQAAVTLSLIHCHAHVPCEENRTDAETITTDREVARRLHARLQPT